MGGCFIQAKSKQKDHSQIGSRAICVCVCVCTFYFYTCSFVFSICILWLWPLANVTASLGGTQTSGTQCRLSLDFDIVCYSHVVACVKVLVTLTYNYLIGTNLPCLQSSWCSNGLLSLCCVVLLISKIKFETKIKLVSLPLLRANKQRKCGI